MKVVWRILFVTVQILIVVIVVALGLECVVFPTLEERGLSKRLSSELANARAVTLIEFATKNPYAESEPDIGEVILKRVTASPQQLDRLRQATKPELTFGLFEMNAMCFDPHHRVEVIRKDGSKFTCAICFECENLEFDHEGDMGIPVRWLPRLREFFRDAGMPPLAPDQYERMAEKARSKAMGAN